MEHMAFQGTEKYPTWNMQQQIYGALGMTFGADVNAFTSFRQTCFTFTCKVGKTDLSAITGTQQQPAQSGGLNSFFGQLLGFGSSDSQRPTQSPTDDDAPDQATLLKIQTLKQLLQYLQSGNLPPAQAALAAQQALLLQSDPDVLVCPPPPPRQVLLLCPTSPFYKGHTPPNHNPNLSEQHEVLLPSIVGPSAASSQKGQSGGGGG